MGLKTLFPNEILMLKWKIDDAVTKITRLVIRVTIFITILLVLCFTITTQIQVDSLYQSFDTFLAEYQSLGNANLEPAVPVEKAPAPAGNYLNPYTQ